jgi:hypothetical protein
VFKILKRMADNEEGLATIGGLPTNLIWILGSLISPCSWPFCIPCLGFGNTMLYFAFDILLCPAEIVGIAGILLLACMGVLASLLQPLLMNRLDELLKGILEVG